MQVFPGLTRNRVGPDVGPERPGCAGGSGAILAVPGSCAAAAWARQAGCQAQTILAGATLRLDFRAGWPRSRRSTPDTGPAVVAARATTPPVELGQPGRCHRHQPPGPAAAVEQEPGPPGRPTASRRATQAERARTVSSPTHATDPRTGSCGHARARRARQHGCGTSRCTRRPSRHRPEPDRHPSSRARRLPPRCAGVATSIAGRGLTDPRPWHRLLTADAVGQHRDCASAVTRRAGARQGAARRQPQQTSGPRIASRGRHTTDTRPDEDRGTSHPRVQAARAGLQPRASRSDVAPCTTVFRIHVRDWMKARRCARSSTSTATPAPRARRNHATGRPEKDQQGAGSTSEYDPRTGLVDEVRDGTDHRQPAPGRWHLSRTHRPHRNTWGATV